jgi:hypothetical protein
MEVLNNFKFGPIDELKLDFDSKKGKKANQMAISATLQFRFRQSAVHALWTLRDNTKWNVGWYFRF